jgi:DNA-binding MarR family transcriptional regulator
MESSTDNKIEQIASDASHEVYLNLQKIFRCINIGRSYEGTRLPITIMQMRILSLFNEREVINISEISRMLGMSLQSATNHIHRLEVMDYLERSKNRHDKRVSEVHLTSKGKKRLSLFRSGEIKSIKHLLNYLDSFEEKLISEALENAALLLEKATFKKTE